MSTRLKLLFVSLAALTSCRQEQRLPTVILITLDTTRSDHLATYGYERATDPFLSTLAKRSRVFEHAVPTATWTLPSHASIFTGLHPAEHGSWNQKLPSSGEDASAEVGVPPLSPSLPLLTTRLDEAGYHLIGAVGGPFTAAKYGFDRHFDSFTDPGQRGQLTGKEINVAVQSALEKMPTDEPLFLFVNYFDAHAPYNPPDRASWPFPSDVGNLQPIHLPEGKYSALSPPAPELLQRAIDQYDRELLVQDEALEALFQDLEHRGLLENALVFVTADHGESFGELGVYGHGGLPYDSVVRVPLVIYKTPLGPRDRVVAPISLASIPSTILATLDLPSLPGSRGIDLLADHVAEPGTENPVYSEHRTQEDWIGTVRSTQLKYARPVDLQVSTSTEILFDLSGAETPIDITAIDESTLKAALQLRGQLTGLIESWRPQPADLSAAKLNEEEQARLADLGYAE